MSFILTPIILLLLLSNRWLINTKLKYLSYIIVLLYFTGAMAGLAIGMIILGLIVAFAGLMVYLKVAHKTTDDVAIQFKRHFDEQDG